MCVGDLIIARFGNLERGRKVVEISEIFPHRSRCNTKEPLPVTFSSNNIQNSCYRVALLSPYQSLRFHRYKNEKNRARDTESLKYHGSIEPVVGSRYDTVTLY